jgi:UDPglucose 6-dehydrogenase
MAVISSLKKLTSINQKKSPIQDEYIEKYLAEKDLNLVATLDAEAAYKDADFVVIAAPTNYDSKKNFFDTSAVEKPTSSWSSSTIRMLHGHQVYDYRSALRQLFVKNITAITIIFSPEFLRESKALYDNLYPSRIIVAQMWRMLVL